MITGETIQRLLGYMSEINYNLLFQHYHYLTILSYTVFPRLHHLCGRGWFGRETNNVFVLPCVVQCLKSVPLLCRITLV